MDVNRSQLLVGLASVFAGMTVLMVVLGFVYNLFILVVALPLGAAAYLFWYHATGRLGRSVRRQARAEADRRRRQTAGEGPAWDGWEDPSGSGSTATGRSRPRVERTEAMEVLGVDRGADEETIRRAYREKVKDVHPDTESGSKEEFQRVQAAYERLTE
ncbi:MAG: J domain-containing protein [Halobacteriales archaeon]